jgi:hypothetical protein
MSTLEATIGKVSTWVGDAIRNFAALFFFVFAAGAIYGVVFTQLSWLFLLLPILAGLVVYYNRNIGLVAAVAVLVFFIF